MLPKSGLVLGGLSNKDMTKRGRPKKEEKFKKVKYGISIDRYLFDKMKKEDVSVSKFIQNLVEKYYGKKKNI